MYEVSGKFNVKGEDYDLGVVDKEVEIFITLEGLSSKN